MVSIATAVCLMGLLMLLVGSDDVQGTEAQSIWDGQLSFTASEQSADDVAFHPHCSVEDVVEAVMKQPNSHIGHMSMQEIVANKSYVRHDDMCVYRNAQGAFTDGLYSMDGSLNNFVAHYPNTYGGNVKLSPAPAGRHVLTTSRATYFHTTYSLSLSDSFQYTSKLAEQRDVVYVWSGGPGGRLFRFADGSRYMASDHEYSANGRYIVVKRGGMIDKIDLHTLEMTPVYYANRDRANSITISNDGRYVGYMNNNTLRVIDTDGCEVSYQFGEWEGGYLNPVIGCDVSEDIIPQMHSAGAIDMWSGGFNRWYSRPYFAPASNKLRFSYGLKAYGQADVSWTEFEITAEEYVSTARGYVALGDSYVSGEGDLQGGKWYEPGTDEHGDKSTFAGRNLCHLSQRSYPYLIARELGYLTSGVAINERDFYSFACSGAVIHNVVGGAINGTADIDEDQDFYSKTNNQYRFIPEAISELLSYQPGYLPQIDRLRSPEVGEEDRGIDNPEVLTISIGGNDADFGGFLKSCLSPGDCPESVEGSYRAAQLGARIAKQKDRLVRVFEDVKAATPEARIYVHGYPEFLSDRVSKDENKLFDHDNCGLNVRLSHAERVVAVQGIRYMNEVIEAAARHAGVFYVDVSDVLDGNRLCDSDNDVSYVNGVTAGNDLTPLLNICLWRSGCIGSESYHPNQLAHERYMARILTDTGYFSDPMPSPVPTVVPQPPEFFGDLTRDYVDYINAVNVGEPIVIAEPGYFIGANGLQANGIEINQGGLLPGSTLQVVIESTPTALGTFTVSEQGDVTVVAQLPEGFAPGSHTVFLYGVDKSGKDTILYEPVSIRHSEADFDGDGVDDLYDSCVTLANSGLDIDQDEVDDVCDQQVVAPTTNNPDDAITKGEISDETEAGNEQIVQAGQVLAETTSASLEQTGTDSTAIFVAGALVIGVSVVAALHTDKRTN